ncbi:retrotransposon protein, putative, Ty1-copia subclass [Cucumis melo var. makuwa]|uniref:Retrotransposon protein, putative, Ty1-copia subclass n=1 Tax=Cucumis melo var. makuwa TaxID=1194695 RepID=A0A5D3DV78_CUCMM|nr:retrotransposon protein, putative, Ty1-copia subclass [Cucumis melo var. makuwa]TYK27215.1 retrotransposon protein, putative, Ty1-copia subclass [Cucumis melo var. makuwa]
MNSELHKQFEEIDAFTIIGQLKAMFQDPVSLHFLKMKSYLEQLRKLGLEISRELAIDIVLQSLPDTFDQFLNIKSNFKVLMVEKGKNPNKRGRDQGKGNDKVAVKTSKVYASATLPRSRPNPKEPKPSKGEESYHCKKIGIGREIVLFI